MRASDSTGGDPHQLIEFEIGSGHHRARRRHFETFWGRWIVPPDPDKTRTAQPGIRPVIHRDM